MTLTKADIVAEIYAQGFLNKTEASDAVEKTLEIMKETLSKGEEMLISGFGKWSVRSKAERRGRNPQTGSPLTLAPRRVVTFRPSRVLKIRIEGSEQNDLAPQEQFSGDDKSRALRPGYF